MTPEEHKLMVEFMAGDMAMHDSLMQILKDKGIIGAAELARIRAEASDPKRAARYLSLARVQYVAAAKLLGLEIELPEPGEL